MNPYFDLLVAGVPLRYGVRSLYMAPAPTKEHPHRFACWPGCLVLSADANSIFYVGPHPGTLVDSVSLSPHPFPGRRKINRDARRFLKLELACAKDYWREWASEHSQGQPAPYRSIFSRVRDYITGRPFGFATTLLAAETEIVFVSGGEQYARQTTLRTPLPNWDHGRLLQPGHKIFAWAKMDPAKAAVLGGWYCRAWYIDTLRGADGYHDGHSRPLDNEKDFLADTSRLRPGVPSPEFDVRSLVKIETYRQQALDDARALYLNQQRIRKQRGIK